MKQTDHDRSLYLIHKYMLEHPSIFHVEEPPSYGFQKGADLLAHNLCMNVMEYIEVELDATYSRKFKRMANRAKDLFDKYDKPVRLWLVSCSDKWIVGVRRQIRELGEPYRRKLIVDRISPWISANDAFLSVARSVDLQFEFSHHKSTLVKYSG